MTHAHVSTPTAGIDRARLLLPLTIASAVLVAANGLLHLKIWNSDYRSIPSAVPGAWVVRDGFPVNTVLAIGLAIALVVLRKQVLVPLAAAVFTAGSLVALVISHTVGLFGWKEIGWSGNPTEVIVVEVLSLVAIAALVVVQRQEAGDTRS